MAWWAGLWPAGRCLETPALVVKGSRNNSMFLSLSPHPGIDLLQGTTENFATEDMAKDVEVCDCRFAVTDASF